MATVTPYYRKTKSLKFEAGGETTQQDGWRVRWKDHHNKWHQTIFRGSKRDATKFKDSLVVRVDQIRAGLAPPPERTMRMTDAFELYLKHLKSRNRAYSTLKRYTRSFIAFKGFMHKEVKLNDIKRRDVEQFRISRLESCKEASVSTDLRHLKAFFNWCHGMDFLIRSPLIGIKINTSTKPVRFLSVDEESALLEAIANDKKACDLVRFYLHSGMRASELLPPRFEWKNVLQNEIVFTGKQNKVRHIGLTETMKSILESRKHLPSPFPYTYDQVYHLIVKKYYPIAGIQNACLHTLRRTSAARLLQHGIDIYRVSKFLGHSSVIVTEKHYVDLLREDYQVIANVMESIKIDSDIIPISEPIPAYSGVLEQLGIVHNGN